MTNEDKKLILEWCGGIFKEYKDEDGCPAHWELPSGSWVFDTDPLDLNFYFKHAVPRLSELGWRLRLIGRPESRLHWAAHLVEYNKRVNKQNRNVITVFDEDPAEAFGQALLKLVKEGLNESNNNSG